MKGKPAQFVITNAEPVEVFELATFSDSVCFCRPLTSDRSCAHAYSILPAPHSWLSSTNALFPRAHRFHWQQRAPISPATVLPLSPTTALQICRSWFAHDTVIQDGELLIGTVVDPVLLALPLLCRARDTSVSSRRFHRVVILVVLSAAPTPTTPNSSSV